MMSVEQSVEWELTGETEVLRENLPQHHFVHYKSHMTRPGLEPGPPSGWAMAQPFNTKYDDHPYWLTATAYLIL
jgi:hypothetical protein